MNKNVVLKPVLLEEREILSNLMEKYHYEFTQYEPRDVNKLGLYGYQYLDYYWTDNKRWAYFIIVDGNLAGFVLVRNHPLEGTETDFVISEFFVMYKYRRFGVGRQAFNKVLDKHRGRWRICLHPKNTESMHFWESVTREYTEGQYELVRSHPKVIYKDGSLGNVFLFRTL